MMHYVSQERASSSTDILLRVDAIDKSFGETSVLNHVSFAMKKNEIVGIIGPSGGGKTTLLKCIDFLERIDTGSIEFNAFAQSFVLDTSGIRIPGNKIDSEQTSSSEAAHIWRKKIGFVFQGFNLWDERTVLNNLILAPMIVRGDSREEAKQRAHELSKQFDIEDKLDVKVRHLSGGQKQRVAIIRALMMDPSLILLDEVTSALDPILTVGVMEAISSLRVRGLAMLLVSHHLEFVSSLCDRVIFLSQGKVVQFDTPEVLKKFPANNDVAKFLAILRAAR